MRALLLVLVAACGGGDRRARVALPPTPTPVAVAATTAPAAMHVFPLTGVVDFDVDANAVYALIDDGKTLVRIDRRTGAKKQLGTFPHAVKLVGFTADEPVVASPDESGHLDVIRAGHTVFTVTSEDPNCLSAAAAGDEIFTLTFEPSRPHPYVLTRRDRDGRATATRDLGSPRAKVPVCDRPHVSGARVAVGIGTSPWRQYVSLDRTLQGPEKVLWTTSAQDCFGVFGASFDGGRLYAAEGSAPAKVIAVDLTSGATTTLASFTAGQCVALLGTDDAALYLRAGTKQLELPKAGGSPRAIDRAPPFGTVRGDVYFWAEADGIHSRPARPG